MSSNVKDIFSNAGIQLGDGFTNILGDIASDVSLNYLGEAFGLQSNADELASFSNVPVDKKIGSNQTFTLSNHATIYNGSDLYPKFKFLYKVKFFFHPDLEKYAKSVGVDLSNFKQSMSYLIKKVDLPKFEMEYREIDIYNQKTKVLTNVRHSQTVAMSFIDDIGNNLMQFIKLHMSLYAPGTRRVFETGTNIEDNTMNFSGTTMAGLDTSYSSSVGEIRNILSKVVIEQFFFTPSSHKAPSQSYSMNRFTFTNPRIEVLEMGDLSHEMSDINEIHLGFNYDLLCVDLNQKTVQTDTHPLSDISIAIQGSLSQGKTGNPLLDKLLNQSNKLLNNIGGKVINDFTNQIERKLLNNTAFGKVANGTFSPVIRAITGDINGNLKNQLKSAVNKDSQLYNSIKNLF